MPVAKLTPAPGLCTIGVPIGRTTRARALCVAWWDRSPVRGVGVWRSGGAVSMARGTRDSGVAPRLRLWVRVAAFGAASFALCYDQRGGPDTSAPKAVRGQKRLSTLAEALPLAREIGAGSRAPREIGAGSRGCLSLWRVRSMRDHTPSGIVPSKESARMRGRRSRAHFGRAPH